MKTGRRTFVQRALAALAVAALPAAVPRPAAAHGPATRPTARARAVSSSSGAPRLLRSAPPVEWQPTGPELPFQRVFTPASGALLAATPSELYRSDDAGASWYPLPLPPTTLTRRAIEVDPTDHRVIYADADGGLQRSDDDGATWTPIFPTPRPTLRVAVSPADPRVLYVGQLVAPGFGGSFWFFRSLDGGGTWDQLEEHQNSLCFWHVPILQPHPTDPARVFRTAGCYAGRDLSDDLLESRDAAATWKAIASPRLAFPRVLVGGAGAEPARFYLAVHRDARAGGSLLLGSTDDGATWSEIRSIEGGGTVQGADQTSITMDALAYDPAAPMRVFLALGRRTGFSRTVESSTVTWSVDGGAAWSTLGQEGLPAIHELALGVDGRNLFAATERGVWRLSLG